MRNTAKIRAPHGATSLAVLDALYLLHRKGGRRLQVSRVDLLDALRLSETTVDDRLRTLIKAGRVLRVGRGLYEPAPHPGDWADIRFLPLGVKKVTNLPDGTVLTQTRTAKGSF